MIGSGGWRTARIIDELAEFQSLLFWMIGSGRSLEAVQAALRRVSILVVLDDWFGQAIYVQTIQLSTFQSLLFWMIGSGLSRDRSAYKTKAGFQSLLFWMIGSGIPRLAKRPSALFVSILVVLDDWFGHREVTEGEGL